MEVTPKAIATVLVVDDMEANRELLRRWLTSDGYHVLVAGDSETALNAVLVHRPEVVLLDIMLPGRSGFDVCELIKKNPATAHIAVVLITGLQHPANQIRGREVGADDFVTKPYDHETIRLVVQTALMDWVRRGSAAKQP